MFIYLKWWSDRPQSDSFRVKATFLFYSADRILWKHHSPLISVTYLKRETRYPEWGWLWSIRSSLQIDEHSQFVQLTFSKSFSDQVAHLSWLFIWAYAIYPHICGYPHTLCRFIYAVLCRYAHINLHKPQPHMHFLNLE